MGTQQILMIVLSVIVVGAAVAVGIQMFDTQATNSQRTAIAADLQNFGAQILAFQRTPVSMGGGKGASSANLANLASYLGFNDAGNTLKNANATYTLAGFGYTTTGTTITAVSSDSKTKLTLTVDLLPANVAAATDPSTLLSVAVTPTE